MKNVFSQLHLMKGKLTEPLPLVRWMHCKYIGWLSYYLDFIVGGRNEELWFKFWQDQRFLFSVWHPNMLWYPPTYPLDTWGCCLSGKAAMVWSLTTHLCLILYEIYVKLFLVYYVFNSLLVAMWFYSFQQIIAIINYVFSIYRVCCSMQVTLLIAADRKFSFIIFKTHYEQLNQDMHCNHLK